MGRKQLWVDFDCVVCGTSFRKKPAYKAKVCGGPYGECSKELNRRAHLGKEPGNKGVKLPEWQVELLRSVNTGRKQSSATVEKRVSKLRGRKRTPAFREALSKRYKGNGNPSWRGGVSALRYRQSPQEQEGHRVWRKSVFERDDYTCQGCGKRGGYIEADHIKPWALYPELRQDIRNGQTLCKPCHGKKTSAERKEFWPKNPK